MTNTNRTVRTRWSAAATAAAALLAAALIPVATAHADGDDVGGPSDEPDLITDWQQVFTALSSDLQTDMTQASTDIQTLLTGAATDLSAGNVGGALNDVLTVGEVDVLFVGQAALQIFAVGEDALLFEPAADLASLIP